MVQEIYIKRNEEALQIEKSFIDNSFLIYSSNIDSGISYFLNHIYKEYSTDNSYSFYIDAGSHDSLPAQLIYYMLSSISQKDLKKHVYKGRKGKIIWSIIKPFLGMLNVIPYVSLGTVALNFIDGISKTLDVDYGHFKDYKIEKALFQTLEELLVQKNHQIYFFIDTAENLNLESIQFLSKLMTLKNLKILFSMSKNKYEYSAELISKINANKQFSNLANEFPRPSNAFIQELFESYQKEYKKEYKQIFESKDYNIHVIMSYINGFEINFFNFDHNSLEILKILSVLGQFVSIALLKDIYDANCMLGITSYSLFESYINALESKSVIIRNRVNEIKLNDKICSESDLCVSYADKIKISSDAVTVFYKNLDCISIDILKFAIKNSKKSYSLKKKFILKLLERQRDTKQVEVEYLDSLFSFDTKEELFNVCKMYYEIQIYESPLRRLENHLQFKNCKAFKKLYALICERLHRNNYVVMLEKLFESERNEDEKCLLLSVLFVGYLNSDSADKYKEIVFKKDSSKYYKKFENSVNYVYLLRNVCYYLDDVLKSISGYRKCLSVLYKKDTINYNRTLSNYFCFLLRHYLNEELQSEIIKVSDEIKNILEFNDTAYEYMNINYGIYLMLFNKGNPIPYFNAIRFQPGTTETPYIYSQINLAIYLLSVDTKQSTKIMTDIEPDVNSTTVPRTKQFYNINKCLVDYANGTLTIANLNKITENPIRANISYVNDLYLKYIEKLDTGEPFCFDDIKSLFLPGFIFYRYPSIYEFKI